jgi:hypothetical protein
LGDVSGFVFDVLERFVAEVKKCEEREKSKGRLCHAGKELVFGLEKRECSVVVIELSPYAVGDLLCTAQHHHHRYQTC